MKQLIKNTYGSLTSLAKVPLAEIYEIHIDKKGEKNCLQQTIITIKKNNIRHISFQY